MYFLAIFEERWLILNPQKLQHCYQATLRPATTDGFFSCQFDHRKNLLTTNSLIFTVLWNIQKNDCKLRSGRYFMCNKLKKVNSKQSVMQFLSDFFSNAKKFSPFGRVGSRTKRCRWWHDILGTGKWGWYSAKSLDRNDHWTTQGKLFGDLIIMGS